MDKRRMCPHCRAFITTDDKVCPYCDTKVGPRAIDVRMPDGLLGGLVPASRFLNILILVINSGLYAALMLYSLNSGNEQGLTGIDGQTLYLFGAKYGPAIHAGQFWRLVTAGFLHAGVMHFFFNTWCMFDAGAHVEEAYGSSRMAVIYLVGSVCGFALSNWWSPMALSVGASAGVFALIGAMLAWGMLRQHTAVGQAIKGHYSRWLIYGVLMSFFPGVDMMAHLGGFAGGFAVAWVAGEPGRGDWRDSAWDWGAYAAAAVVVVSFAMMGLALSASQ